MKKKSLLLLIPFAAAAAVALGSCGKEPGPQCDQASVILDSQAITIEINETKQLTASSNMEGCSVEVNWRSDDASIASVDQNGVVTGHKNGTTTVYANDVPCLVAVGTGRPDIPITGIELVKPTSDSITMVVGDTQEVLVNVLPNEAPASDKVVNLSSSKESVVIINENGEIEAVGAGTAKVTITSEKNPEVTKVISITVEDPVIPFPSKTSDDATLVDVGPVLDGATINFVAKLNDKFYSMDSVCTDNKYFKHIESSVENDVLTLGEGSGSFFVIKNRDGSYSFQTASGKYLAAKNNGNNLIEVGAIGPDSSFNIEIVDGEATITCIDPTNTDHNTLFLNSSKGSERFACYKSDKTYPKPHVYAKAPVPVPATGILLDKSEATIEIDGEVTLVPEVLPSYAIEKTVTWTTEGKGIVSVDNGKVKGLMAGEETVTASTVNGKTATCKITVVTEIVPVDHIELNNTTMTLDIDDVSESLTATVFPEDATFKGIVWSSSEEDIVEVDPDTGKLTAVGVGASTITVTSTTDSSKTASCVVSVNAASDGVIHAYQAAMALEDGGQSDKEYTISGRITFIVGNDLVVQDGDHAILVNKTYSTPTTELGKKATLRCIVKNNKGAAETLDIKKEMAPVVITDDVVSVNKALIDTKEKMDAADFYSYVDFKNLIKKSELTKKSSPNRYEMDVNFKGDLEGDPIKLVLREDILVDSVKAEIDSTMIDGELEITECYVGNGSGKKQVCLGPNSVATDKTIYVPDTVHVKNGESEITALNMVEGDVVNLTANILPVKAPQEVTWSTEDTEIISVDNGKVTALKAGEATLTVTSADETKHTDIAVTVTENEVLVTSIELDEKAITLALDDEKQLIATVLPVNATHPELVWTIEGEEGVVSVNNGLVTALKAGEVIVKASNANSGLSASCTVTVVNKYIDVDKVDKVTLTAAADSLNLGSYASGSNDEYAWTQLANNSGNIQGNGDSSKDSELHNKYAYSRPIKYVKITVGSAISANNTIEMRFGNSRMPIDEVIPLGSGTVYDITTAGSYVVIKPEVDATFFSLKNTKGATYFSSIEIGFEEYNVPIEGIELNKESLSLVVEESFMLEATLNPSDTTHTTLTYSSDHPEIANVGTDGIISAYAPGTAIITVATDDPEISATCEVTVVAAKVPVTKVELTDHETEILQGGCTTLTATVSPDNATITDLIWSVEEGKEDIISVDEDGCVTGLQPGTAKVIVKSVDNPAAFDECEVTVEERFIDVSEVDTYKIDAESLGLTSTDYVDGSNEYFAWSDLKVNSGKIQGTFDKSNDSELHNIYGFSKDITYILIEVGSKSSENATAEVRFGDSAMPTDNATLVGKDTEYKLDAAGHFVIMAPEDGFNFFSFKPTNLAVYIKSITVGFNEYVEHVTGVSLDKETTILEEGASEQLTATVSPDNASDKSVTWSSSDESIATVVDGKITAVNAGEATITVKTTDGEFEAKCVVTVIEKVIDVENITLDKETLDLVEGENSTLVATITPDDATYPEHTWSSSDETVATVDQNGKVTAVGAGEATITVKVDDDESKYAECVVTVTAAVKHELPYNGSFSWDSETDSPVFPEGVWTGTGEGYLSDKVYGLVAKDEYVQSIKLFEETTAIQVDVTSIVNTTTDAERIVTVYALNDAGEVVNSATFNPDFASAGSLDKVLELATTKSVVITGEGITGIKIAFTKTNNNKLALVSVNVIDAAKVSGVTLDESELTMEVGETGALVATVMPETASNKNYTFSSDHPEIVSVDENTGAIEALAIGNATITVTTEEGGKTATCAIEVVAKVVDVTDVSLDKNALALVEGEESTLVATITPNDATYSTITWTSSDETVATVDQTGKVTAVGAGEATITATAEKYTGISDECVVTVTEAPRQNLPYNGSFSSTSSKPNYPEGWTGNAEAYYTTGFSFKKANEYIEAIKLFDVRDKVEVSITSLINSADLDTGVMTVYGLNDKGEIVATETFAPNHASYSGIADAQKAATPQIVTLEGEGISGIKIVYTTYSKNILIFSVDVIDPSVVTGVELNEHELEMIVGDTNTLVATVSPNTATDKSVTFTSNNTGAVTVDAATGAIEAVGVGKATITVTTTDGSFTDTCEINVSASKVAVTGVEFAKDSIKMAAGDKETVAVTVLPTDAFDKSVSYSSDNTDVATVDENGEITAIKAGTATITVTTTDGSFTDTCDVTVLTKATITAANDFPGGSYAKNNYVRHSVDGSGLVFESYQANLNGGEIQFEKTNGKLWNVSPITGLAEIRFTVSSGAATVYAGDELKTKDNEITPVEGVYTIPEDCPYFFIVGSKDSATKISDIVIICDSISEYKIPVESVTLDQTELTMKIGDEDVTLVPTISPATAEPQALAWASDNETVATVVDGVVTAVGAGTANITYTVDGIQATCVVTVKENKALASITVTGDLTNKRYLEGAEFDPEGLVATATYTDDSTEVITNDVEWIFDPTTANSTSLTSVSVKAKLDAIESSSVTISNIEVAEAKTLDFSFKTNPGGWPTANSTSLTEYTYTIDGTDYSFGLINCKSNSGYLMMTKTAVLGLPAIDGYKLVVVEATNSSGCSTSTKVGVSSASGSASYITGGAAQTWATTNTTYTYELSGTAEETVYYLYVTSANAQVVSLHLVYEKI